MKDNDNGKRFHITLNRIDLDCLEFMRLTHGVSMSAAIRVSIRAAAKNLGFNGPEKIPESAGP